MNWLLVVIFYGFSSGGFINSATGGNVMLEGVHASREECQTALEAYAKKSGATEITLACIEGESFKPVPKRVMPHADK